MMPNSGKGKQSPKKSAGKLKHNGKSKTSKTSLNNPLAFEETSLSPRNDGDLFSLIKTSDNEKILPFYTQIYKRPKEEIVNPTELYSLQFELETLLSSVIIRSRVLQEEINYQNSGEDSKNKKGRLGLHKTPLSQAKGSKNLNKHLKRFKDIAQNNSPKINFTKVKGIPLNSSSPSHNFNTIERGPPDSTETNVTEIIPPKNDTLIRFWSSVEPYCADFTLEDIKLLEDLIKDHDIDEEFQKIPPLGKHYSLKWAQEDLMEEQEAGNQNKVKGNIADANNMLKRADKLNETPATGPLTQRLISVLMEENIMVPIQETTDSKKCRGGENQTPRTGLLNNFSLKNSLTFERILRKELEEQGILDPTEQTKTEDDEILKELKACQAELKTISNHNIEQLKRLLESTKKELVKQDFKRQLQAVDNEVLEIYKKLNSKHKDMPPTEKEQQQAWALLRQREFLIRTIDLKEEPSMEIN